MNVFKVFRPATGEYLTHHPSASGKRSTWDDAKAARAAACRMTMQYTEIHKFKLTESVILKRGEQ